MKEKKFLFIAFWHRLMGEIHFNYLSLQVESLVFRKGSNRVTIFQST
jgi:hypothetical protein